jgi:hypothetical protein
MPAWIDALADAGFLSSGHRLGILRFDAPVFTRIAEQYVKPRLAARHANVVADVVVSTPKSVPEFGGMSTEFNSAILRFKQARVTHLIMIENASEMPFFFVKQAESSGFRPRYGFNSYDLPQTVASQSPAAQLKDALAFGWMAPSDIPYGDHPKGKTAWDRCDRIMKAAGFTSYQGSDGFYYDNACDAVFFLEHALARADALTTDGLRAAVERLGTTYDSPYAFGTSFGPRRHDGGSGGRVLRYDGGCECFRNAGAVRSVP